MSRHLQEHRKGVPGVALSTLMHCTAQARHRLEVKYRVSHLMLSHQQIKLCLLTCLQTWHHAANEGIDEIQLDGHTMRLASLFASSISQHDCLQPCIMAKCMPPTSCYSPSCILRKAVMPAAGLLNRTRMKLRKLNSFTEACVVSGCRLLPATPRDAGTVCCHGIDGRCVALSLAQGPSRCAYFPLRAGLSIWTVVWRS